MGKENKNNNSQGFANDGEEVPEANRKTREQKITGAHFVDFDAIHYDPGERPEDLYQRLMALIEDSLLRKDMGITHHDEDIEDDEELSPTLENLVILTWLRLIHPELPKLIKQRYGTELRARTLASIKPEISQALESLLEELRTTEDAKSMRAAVKRFPKTKQSSFVPRSNFKSCPLCKSAGRPDRHFLSQCTYLPQQDRQFMAKARAVSEIHDVDECDLDNHDNNDSTFQDQFPVASNRVQIQQSPYIDAYYGHNPTRLTIDSGATGNMIRASAATKLNAKITSSSQSAHQADGSSPLTVVGETRLTFTRDKHQLYFEGLVVENLDSDILAGIPFMEKTIYLFVPHADSLTHAVATKYQLNKAQVLHSDLVRVDPDGLLQPCIKEKFRYLLRQYDYVFSPTFKGYNGAVEAAEAKVNMGPVQPPQRKGRIPQYQKTQLVTLQEKFNELEDIGVFKKTEDIGVTVEYLNPSFLIKKPNGGFRLVTAFADVGRYSKPQPSLMPDVDSTLRQIAQWKHIVISDLTKSFYQIPLHGDSMKYCGVSTPFCGVRVYVRSAMGMPGSETALEELTCRVLGHLVQEGVVAKIADDLYCGGNSPEELLTNWERVLQALQKCSLNLSATKTIIAPKQATILGWIWELGSIRASPHRIATLSNCQPPKTVRALRSFVGAYKVLSRVIKNSSGLLSLLENAVAGSESKDTILWTEELNSAFTSAQNALSTNRSIALPRPNDQLWIVTDGALKTCGLGATLYINRNDKLLLAGFFSAKLRQTQRQWLPSCVLTDSKPCVQAFEKLCRGEFSSSPRVSTFLSTASRFQVSIRHVSGLAILPSDYSSRNAPNCDNPACQICNFIHLQEECVVRHVTTADILNGTVKLPFTSRAAWLSNQTECSDLRRTVAHLRQGTRPSKKLTNIKDIKRYLNVASLANDGLLVVKRNLPFTPCRELIIVPRQVLDGLITSIHIKLDHPSCHQMKSILQRYFYALDMDKAIESVTSSCHQCVSLLKTPKVREEQNSADPPETIGSSFAADVLKRERQLVFVLRECVTSYTFTKLLDTERHHDLRDAIIQLLAEVHPLDGPFAVIRTDPASGFKTLVKDELLARQRITIELGRPKNVNKNPVAEKAIQELEDEILRSNPSSPVLTPLTLSLVTARLNTRIRNRGLSAREMWTQRDQFSNNQIPLTDQNLIIAQHEQRLKNHPHSEKTKCPSGKLPVCPDLEIGDIVYLRCDLNKTKSRDRHLVVAVDTPWCNIRKFIGSQLRQNSYRNLKNVQRLLPHSDDDDDERVTDISSPPSVPVIPKAISDLPTLPSVIPHQNTQLENVEHSLSINSPDILSNDNFAMDTPEETCIDSQENEQNF
ncbi:unnamed protein product [Mytilus edulis]|uniref:Integrase catalytic domain-containing protein n=1 Tax=Mytilus edulis TaxID=6550 RepID=A0A8S3S5K2_MYTED|nr:unnamed protein product [Mytilus edulis]